MNNYRKLIVWQKAHELAYEVYRRTREFPKDELYGITSQLRRAAISVSSNIAEGSGRQTRNETRQFANIALGSLAEVDSLIHVSSRLGYLTADDSTVLESLRNEVGALLWSFHRSLMH